MASNFPLGAQSKLYSSPNNPKIFFLKTSVRKCIAFKTLEWNDKQNEPVKINNFCYC